MSEPEGSFTLLSSWLNLPHSRAKFSGPESGEQTPLETEENWFVVWLAS